MGRTSEHLCVAMGWNQDALTFSTSSIGDGIEDSGYVATSEALLVGLTRHPSDMSQGRYRDVRDLTTFRMTGSKSIDIFISFVSWQTNAHRTQHIPSRSSHTSLALERLQKVLC